MKVTIPKTTTGQGFGQEKVAEQKKERGSRIKRELPKVERLGGRSSKTGG